jgi:hypothetical protein
MRVGAVVVLMLAISGSGAHARDDIRPPVVLPVGYTPSGASATEKLALRLVVERPAMQRFRITPTADGDDLLPGDRPMSELFVTDVGNRPREPGARMNARMSMRLDQGTSSMHPAFSLGGIGGALVRMTDALIDDD